MHSITNHIVILLLLGLLLGCKKEELEPLAIEPVGYTTKTNESQLFYFYYDDGQKVAGGLDEYMAKISSEENTFNTEQLLLLSFKNEVQNFPKEIVPYTFFISSNYKKELNKTVKITYNLAYPFNNTAHDNFEEQQFYAENIELMKLFKIEQGENGNLYYDAEYSFDTIPFSFNKATNEVTFETNDLSAYYGLCWQEQTRQDSISFYISDADLTNKTVFVENETWSVDAIVKEGGSFQNNIITLYYNDYQRISVLDSNSSGWRLGDFSMDISNPTIGLIDRENIDADILIQDDNGYTHLRLTNSTQVIVKKLPEIRQRGELQITGMMYVEMYQREVEVDISIQFDRQR